MNHITVGYYVGNDGKRKRRTRSKIASSKREAVAAIAGLWKISPSGNSTKNGFLRTMQEIHNGWLQGRCEISGTVRYMPMNDIAVDDLQECIDECGHGRWTQENIRCVKSKQLEAGQDTVSSR